MECSGPTDLIGVYTEVEPTVVLGGDSEQWIPSEAQACLGFYCVNGALRAWAELPGVNQHSCTVDAGRVVANSRRASLFLVNPDGFDVCEIVLSISEDEIVFEYATPHEACHREVCGIRAELTGHRFLRARRQDINPETVERCQSLPAALRAILAESTVP